MDDYVEFVHDVRHICLDQSGTGPAFEDMVFFLSVCPELARREYTLHVFDFCCLCLGHTVPNMPRVELGTGQIGTANVDLSCIIEPIQGYLLSSDSEGNFLTDPISTDGCLASLEVFREMALETDDNPWSCVTFHDYENKYSELATS